MTTTTQEVRKTSDIANTVRDLHSGVVASLVLCCDRARYDLDSGDILTPLPLVNDAGVCVGTYEFPPLVQPGVVSGRVRSVSQDRVRVRPFVAGGDGVKLNVASGDLDLPLRRTGQDLVYVESYSL